MNFDKAAIAFVLLLIALFYFFNKQRSSEKKPHVVTSSLADFSGPSGSLRSRLANLPFYLLAASAFLMGVSFLDPHTFKPREDQKGHPLRDPTEGRVLFLDLDQSGSMNEPSGEGKSKIELMKSVVSDFITERPDDLIGLISFARTTHILSPPTLDHQELLHQVADLKTVPSRELDGTAIGYAIFKSANLISSLKEQADFLGKQAPYQIKGTLIVLVTDGLQDPNPLDKDNPYRSMELEQAAAYAREKGVKLYVINIAPELGTAQYLPNLRQMQKITEMTGGRFYHVNSSSDLAGFIEEINQIEASRIYETPDSRDLPSLYKRISYYPSLLLAALALFFLGIILRLTWLRRVAE